MLQLLLTILLICACTENGLCVHDEKMTLRIRNQYGQGEYTLLYYQYIVEIECSCSNCTSVDIRQPETKTLFQNVELNVDANDQVLKRKKNITLDDQFEPPVTYACVFDGEFSNNARVNFGYRSCSPAEDALYDQKSCRVNLCLYAGIAYQGKCTEELPLEICATVDEKLENNLIVCTAVEQSMCKAAVKMLPYPTLQTNDLQRCRNPEEQTLQVVVSASIRDPAKTGFEGAILGSPVPLSDEYKFNYRCKDTVKLDATISWIDERSKPSSKTIPLKCSYNQIQTLTVPQGQTLFGKRRTLVMEYFTKTTETQYSESYGQFLYLEPNVSYTEKGSCDKSVPGREYLQSLTCFFLYDIPDDAAYFEKNLTWYRDEEKLTGEINQTIYSLTVTLDGKTGLYKCMGEIFYKYEALYGRNVIRQVKNVTRDVTDNCFPPKPPPTKTSRSTTPYIPEPTYLVLHATIIAFMLVIGVVLPCSIWVIRDWYQKRNSEGALGDSRYDRSYGDRKAGSERFIDSLFGRKQSKKISSKRGRGNGRQSPQDSSRQSSRVNDSQGRSSLANSRKRKSAR